MTLLALAVCAHPGAAAVPVGGLMAGDPSNDPSRDPSPWRAATAADLPEALVQAWGETPALSVRLDLDGDGREETVLVEVDDARRQARVAVAAGVVLGVLSPAPTSPVSSGLRAHAAGAMPPRDRAPADLVAFGRDRALVEWCLAPQDAAWTARTACYGSRFVGIADGVVRAWEVWD